jgi:hypothetical protein
MFADRIDRRGDGTDFDRAGKAVARNPFDTIDAVCQH